MDYLPIFLFSLIISILLLILYVRKIYIKELKPEKKKVHSEWLQYYPKETLSNGDIVHPCKLTNYPIYFDAKDLETAKKRAKYMLQIWIKRAQQIVDEDNFELVEASPDECSKK